MCPGVNFFCVPLLPRDTQRIIVLHLNNELFFPDNLFSEGEEFESVLPFVPEDLRSPFTIPNNSSCAIVGSSRNLLNGNLGTIIDKHDVVIRINRAPTEGYESDVGSKTSIRFQNQFREAFIPSERVPAIVAYCYSNSNDCLWLKDFLRSSIDSEDTQSISLIHPVFLKHINQIMPKPSTGLIAIITAIHLCESVNVFGFGANKKGEWDYYYDSKLTSKSKNYHFAKREKNILEALETIGLIKIYRGNYRRK